MIDWTTLLQLFGTALVLLVLYLICKVVIEFTKEEVSQSHFRIKQLELENQKLREANDVLRWKTLGKTTHSSN